MPRYILGLDIGSNSVGSAWLDTHTGRLVTGTSVFPAGVDESDDKRGAPKNAKRRMARRTRITLARRAERKRELRLRLMDAGLLPRDEADFTVLLETTDPWELRRDGLRSPLTPYEFGRVLLHLAQHRGALGLRTLPEEINGVGADIDGGDDDGKVKAAIGAVRAAMLQRRARTFGEFIAMVRNDRVHAIAGEDRRAPTQRRGPREYRDPVRNKAGNYEYCSDRAMIRDEFAQLWDQQAAFGGDTARLLTTELRRSLDDESGDSIWRHRGLLFGQRRASWDLGSLGRCVLEPTERCVPHADMYASRYLVVETVNNLRIIERGREPRALTAAERQKILDYLSGPLGMEAPRKLKGQKADPARRPKSTVSVTDLRELMGWGRATKTTPWRFNIEADDDRTINTDWFSREVIHGVLTPQGWDAMPQRLREGLNRAILRHDPDQDDDAGKLRAGVVRWAGLSEAQADALVAAWRRRPRPDAKRLAMSRRAVRNLLVVMDRAEPWPDPHRPGQSRWLTQIEARKLIASDADFVDATTGVALDDRARQRYATGTRGLGSRDRQYMRRHPDELPPAPLLSNPVVRRAIHEVRRHVTEHIRAHGRKPDEIYIELAREASMGAKDADRVLFRNRLRARIRAGIIEAFDLSGRTATQQRAAVDRVVLCVQQGGVCPLCGRAGLTDLMAATGEGCELAHIIPKGSGGHNGLSNLVLSHTKCNRDMGRRTPRQFWSDGVGFDEGMRWIEGIYNEVRRPKPSEVRAAHGPALWACYFRGRDDKAKVQQFAKEVKDIQEVTQRQEAATKHAAKQVMAYLSDALFDGRGLPERGGERRIFATDGMWTSRLRREWGLFFDPHKGNAKGLGGDEGGHRREKNRGDHRHHAVDAVVISLCAHSVQIAWETRERKADLDGVNTADEEAMDRYRRLHPLPPPAPFQSREEFRGTVRAAVFGEGDVERPVCHRPVKRKLVGALHEETLFGPVLDAAGNPTGTYTARKSVLALDPNHLRMPRLETEKEAIARIAALRQRERRESATAARAAARSVVTSAGYKPVMVDAPPTKSGIVRDRGLRARLRECLAGAGIDPADFTPNQIRSLAESGGIRHASGVPIRSVVLLRAISDPVIIDRRRPEHATGRLVREENPASRRAYVGGNNHHIEIRVSQKGAWSGSLVSAYETAQRKLAKLRALRAAEIPRPDAFRTLPRAERARLTPVLRAIEKTHPLVDRSDDEAKGGVFVMSLCEGETLWMRHKHTGDVGFFVVAKLDKPQSIVLVPHWDARAATGRKDAEGRKVLDSKRDQFTATPTDLKNLAPPDHPHAIKVRVGPLGDVHPVDD